MSKLKRARRLVGKTVHVHGAPFTITEVGIFSGGHRKDVQMPCMGSFLGARGIRPDGHEYVFRLSARLNLAVGEKRKGK